MKHYVLERPLHQHRTAAPLCAALEAVHEAHWELGESDRELRSRNRTQFLGEFATEMSLKIDGKA